LKKLSEHCWKALALSLIVVLCYSIGISEALGQSVGVKVGDWAKYDVKREGMPTAWQSYSETEWIRVEVQNVSGTDVTLIETRRLSDGSEENRTHKGDVGNSDSVYIYIIPANLDTGDDILYCGLDKRRINSTVSKSYDKAVRDANQITLSATVPHFTDYLHTISEFLWDKSTGMLLETRFETYLVGYENTSRSLLRLEIVETNLWKIESRVLLGWQQLGLAAAGLFVAAGTTAIICSRSLRNRNTTKEARRK